MIARQGIRLGTCVPLAVAILLPLLPLIAEAGVLAALPLLVVVVPLLLGRFPGEAVIERLAARRTPAHRPSRASAAPRPVRRAVAGLLRARLLIAASFAERPPPVSVTT